MATTARQVLVGKGLKDEDITSAFREMSLFHTKLDNLHGRIMRDTRCSLRSETNPPILGSGNYNPEIVVISDFPDEHEKNVGRAGFSDYAMYLMLFFQRLGLTMNDIYWTFSVKYHTNKMSMKYIEECAPLLKREIQTLNPSIIVSLGNASISALSNKQMRVEDVPEGDAFYDMPFSRIPVISLKHPRAIMNLPKQEFKQATKDMWKQLKVIEQHLHL